MLSSLPNRCVHHHRPTARVGFCLPNIGVPLTICLFLSNRRPVIFKRAPTACDHHFLADTMITCSPGMEHEMVSPHYSPRPFRVPVVWGWRLWSADRLQLQVCFSSGGDVCNKCQTNSPRHRHPSFLFEQCAVKMHLSRLLVWSERLINKEWLVFSYPPSSEIIDYPRFCFVCSRMKNAFRESGAKRGLKFQFNLTVHVCSFAYFKLSSNFFSSALWLTAVGVLVKMLPWKDRLVLNCLYAPSIL